jgi:hypothetical protein
MIRLLKFLSPNKPWKCVFGNHDWFTVQEEFRPHEVREGVYKNGKRRFDGICREERCRDCGWERMTQDGYTDIKKPWEMTVRKMKWDTEKQDYVA